MKQNCFGCNENMQILLYLDFAGSVERLSTESHLSPSPSICLIDLWRLSPPPSLSPLFSILIPPPPPSSSRRTVRDTHVLHGYKRFVALHLFPSLHAFPLLPCPPSWRTTGNQLGGFSRPCAKNIFGACYLDQANIRNRSLFFCKICFLIRSCFNLLWVTLAFNVNSTLPPCLAFVLESCRNSQYYKYMNEQIGNYDEYFDNRLFVKVIFLMGSQND